MTTNRTLEHDNLRERCWERKEGLSLSGHQQGVCFENCGKSLQENFITWIVNVWIKRVTTMCSTFTELTWDGFEELRDRSEWVSCGRFIIHNKTPGERYERETGAHWTYPVPSLLYATPNGARVAPLQRSILRWCDRRIMMVQIEVNVFLIKRVHKYCAGLVTQGVRAVHKNCAITVIW